MVHQGLLSLNSCIGNITNLLAVKLFPLLGMEGLTERNDGQRIHKINKGIAYVALVLKVDGEIEKVVLGLEVLINRLKEHLLRVLVRNVLHHQRCSLVQPVLHLVQVEIELFAIFGGHGPISRSHTIVHTVLDG